VRTVSHSATIAQPPETVFAAAADPFTQLKWDPGTLKSVDKLDPGPLGPGARYRGKFTGFGVVDYEYAEYEPSRRFTHLAMVKMGTMRHTFTFEPAASGTKMTQEGALEPNLLGRLASPLVARMLQRRFQTIATELASYFEHAGQGTPTPPQETTGSAS
jgi:uncharacterized protein YndB with AHSA1/START domain